MRCSLLIFLWLPMVASAAMVVEDDDPAVLSTIDSIIATKSPDRSATPGPVGPTTRPQDQQQPLIAAVLPGNTPAASVAAVSELLGLTVVREGDGLLLSFATAPAKLFISDGKTGRSVTAATWLTEKALKVAVAGMERVDIRSERGRLSIALDGARLSVVSAASAEPALQ